MKKKKETRLISCKCGACEEMPVHEQRHHSQHFEWIRNLESEAIYKCYCSELTKSRVVENGEKYSVRVIFGTDQVKKFIEGKSFTESEVDLNFKEYGFRTRKELDAFILGVDETVGWLECFYEIQNIKDLE